jgi:hypothetical protein
MFCSSLSEVVGTIPWGVEGPPILPPTDMGDKVDDDLWKLDLEKLFALGFVNKFLDEGKLEEGPVDDEEPSLGDTNCTRRGSEASGLDLLILCFLDT